MATTVTPPRPAPTRNLFLGLALGIGCLGIAATSLHALYPSLGSVARFIAYVLVFNLLPGSVATLLLLPTVRGPLFPVFGLATGVSINLLALAPLWLAGWVQGLWLLPAAGAAAMVASRTLRLRLRAASAALGTGRTAVLTLGGAFFLCLTGLLGMTNVLSGGPGDAFSYHFAFQGVIVRGLEQGWP